MVVFYADDDPEDRELFVDAIKEIDPGIRVVLARDGREIINMVQNGSIIPDYIFLDINMPGLSGKECLRKLKQLEQLHAVPIVMYTTTSNKEEFKNLFLLGATDCVIKSASFQAIKDELRSILGSN